MKLLILSYGYRILTQVCDNINSDYPNLERLIYDMWETMENANGSGLAAPQVGQAIRLFVVDSQTTYENLGAQDRKTYFDVDDVGIRETFINAKIISYSEKCWDDTEGCLSIPNLFQHIKRPWSITIEYYNAEFEKLTRMFKGTTARVIQHEYDHTDGVLYIDHLNPLAKKLIESRLKRIKRGQIKTGYPMRFSKKR